MSEIAQGQVVSSCIKLYQVVSSCIKLYQVVSSCVKLYQVVSSCIKLSQVVSQVASPGDFSRKLLGIFSNSHAQCYYSKVQ